MGSCSTRSKVKVGHMKLQSNTATLTVLAKPGLYLLVKTDSSESFEF